VNQGAGPERGRPREIDVARLTTMVGQELGRSDWVEVTQHMIDLFAEATGDDQWIHLDRARAATGPYGTTIAHGYLSLALIPKLMRAIWQVNGVRFSLNYGSNRVRFPAPLRCNSQVRAVAQVQDVREVEGGTEVELLVTVEAEGQAKPVCVAETISRFVH